MIVGGTFGVIVSVSMAVIVIVMMVRHPESSFRFQACQQLHRLLFITLLFVN